MQLILMVTDTLELNVIEQAGDWSDLSLQFEPILTRVLEHAGLQAEGRAVALVLSDDVHIQELNRDFRGKDKPTNVLSFPSDEPEEFGDIIISVNTLKAEAVAQNKTFDNHVCHMVVHGMLHLLGYDHQIEAEAEEMEALEIAILREVGVENPYENS